VKEEVEEATYRERVQNGPELYDFQKLWNFEGNTRMSVSVGFCKFSELRPKHYIISFARGPHVLICVCGLHQNITLLAQGAHFTADFRMKVQDCMLNRT
jgi:hypothetical protein